MFFVMESVAFARCLSRVYVHAHTYIPVIIKTYYFNNIYLYNTSHNRSTTLSIFFYISDLEIYVLLKILSNSNHFLYKSFQYKKLCQFSTLNAYTLETTRMVRLKTIVFNKTIFLMPIHYMTTNCIQN